jgi:hypothetical protein
MNVNESSQATITARPVDKDGCLFIPITARYRLDDLDSKTELIDWTTLTPATEMTITIPGSSNDIIAVSKKRERKVLTVELDTGLSTAHFEEHIYFVKSLHFAQVA